MTKDPIWQDIRKEAEREAAAEPLLEEFLDKSRREEDGLRALIANSRRLLKRADIPSKSMNAIIEILRKYKMDEPYLRDAMVEGVKANSVINDSVWASIEDVAEVVDMVMGHRIDGDRELVSSEDKQ